MIFPGYVLLFIFNLLNSSDAEVDSRIVGGEYTSIKNYPHSVYLDLDNKSWCAASILNHYILLTAAHCVYKNESIIAAVGNSDVTKKFDESMIIAGVAVRIHESYNPEQLGSRTPGDIALVKLERALTFGKRVKRIAIIKSQYYTQEYYEPASIAGWGATSMDNNSQADGRLKHLTNLEIWTRQECVDRFVKFGSGTFAEDIICAGYRSGNLIGHPYKGDSGAALIVRDYIQLGIMKAGVTGDKGEPEAYMFTDVRLYYKWIKRNARKLYCQGRKYKLLNKDCLHG